VAQVDLRLGGAFAAAEKTPPSGCVALDFQFLRPDRPPLSVVPFFSIFDSMISSTMLRQRLTLMTDASLVPIRHSKVKKGGRGAWLPTSHHQQTKENRIKEKKTQREKGQKPLPLAKDKGACVGVVVLGFNGPTVVVARPLSAQ
jgi:hypothetical protein